MDVKNHISMHFDITSVNLCIRITVPRNFANNKVARLSHSHTHAKYEVVFVRRLAGDAPDKFKNIPPLYQHTTFNENTAEEVHATSRLCRGIKAITASPLP